MIRSSRKPRLAEREIVSELSFNLLWTLKLSFSLISVIGNFCYQYGAKIPVKNLEEHKRDLHNAKSDEEKLADHASISVRSVQGTVENNILTVVEDIREYRSIKSAAQDIGIRSNGGSSIGSGIRKMGYYRILPNARNQFALYKEGEKFVTYQGVVRDENLRRMVMR